MEVNTQPWIDRGRGPAVVLLHYYSGAASSWTPVIDRLCESYRCVAINLPGFGAADWVEEEPSPVPMERVARRVLKQIDEIGLSDYRLVGHSMGGKLAMLIASIGDGPSAVGLIAPSPATTEPMEDDVKQRMIDGHPSRDNAETTLADSAVLPMKDDYRELAIKTHLMADHRAWRWWLEQGMNESIIDQLNVQVPTQVLASADDPVIPIDLAQRDVVQRIDGAVMDRVNGIGHLMPLEDPAMVARWVGNLATDGHG